MAENTGPVEAQIQRLDGDSPHVQVDSEAIIRCQEALKLLSSETALAVAEYQGDPKYGDVDTYASAPDGSPISQASFLSHYVDLNNRVVQRARELLSEHPSLELLQSYREEVEASRGEMKLPDGFEGLDHENKLRSIDSMLRNRVVEVSTQDSSHQFEEFAVDLAILTLDNELRRIELVKLLEERESEVRQHGAVLENARANAHNFSAPARNAFDQMFINILESQYAIHGHIPPLIIFNDIDNNLGRDDSNNRMKPGDSIDLLLDGVLDKIEKTPGRQRVPLLHSFQKGTAFGEAVAEMYREAGRRLDIFPDAKSSAELAENEGVSFQLLTANMEMFGEGVRELFPESHDIPITGQAYDSVIGPEKPTFLGHQVLEHPDAVIVLSDDGDARIINNLLEPRFVEGLSYELPLQDLVLFVCRLKTELDGKPFKLHSTLNDLGIPHGVNYQDAQGDDTFHGYQGTQRLIELYGEWKRSKLSQGAPS